MQRVAGIESPPSPQNALCLVTHHCFDGQNHRPCSKSSTASRDNVDHSYRERPESCAVTLKSIECDCICEYKNLSLSQMATKGKVQCAMPRWSSLPTLWWLTSIAALLRTGGLHLSRLHDTMPRHPHTRERWTHGRDFSSILLS